MSSQYGLGKKMPSLRRKRGKKNLNSETSKLASMFAVMSHMSVLRLKKNCCSEKAWLQAIENAGQHTRRRKCY